MSRKMQDAERSHGVRLDAVRRQIEAVDGELVALIARRCSLARLAGARKLDAGLPMIDPGQEASVVRRGAARARAAGVDDEGVRQIFWCLIDLSRRTQAVSATRAIAGGDA